MKINLVIGEAEKTFHAPFVKGLVFRQFIKLRKDHDLNDMNEDTMEKIVELIVEAYNGQFTIDEFWNGIDAREVITTIQAFIQELITGGSNKQGK